MKSLCMSRRDFFETYLTLIKTEFLLSNILWHIYTMQDCNIETCSRNYSAVDEVVFSPCRAEQSRVASLRLLPGNSYKHLDDARVGKGHVTTSAVSQQLKRFPTCQIKGL
jgi:hypothetical protein